MWGAVGLHAQPHTCYSVELCGKCLCLKQMPSTVSFNRKCRVFSFVLEMVRSVKEDCAFFTL